MPTSVRSYHIKFCGAMWASLPTRTILICAISPINCFLFSPKNKKRSDAKPEQKLSVLKTRNGQNFTGFACCYNKHIHHFVHLLSFKIINNGTECTTDGIKCQHLFFLIYILLKKTANRNKKTNGNCRKTAAAYVLLLFHIVAR